MINIETIKLRPNSTLKDAIEVINNGCAQVACVLDDNNQLIGLVTDGDIRRKLLKSQKPLSALFVDDALVHSIQTPIVVHPTDLLFDAVTLMDKNQVWDLPVVNDQNKLLGILHSHRAVAVLLGIVN